MAVRKFQSTDNGHLSMQLEVITCSNCGVNSLKKTLEQRFLLKYFAKCFLKMEVAQIARNIAQNVSKKSFCSIPWYSKLKVAE